MKDKIEELAEELDYFYAQNNPYDRYDSVGSFSPEYDEDNEGLNQILDCLYSGAGREHLVEYLNNIINDDCDDAIKEKANELILKISSCGENLKKQEIEQV